LEVFCLDEWTPYNAWDVTWWNNEMTSFVCGSKVQYQICCDWLGGDCSYGYGNWGAGFTMNAGIGNNDDMSSLLMAHYDPDGGVGAATFYEHADCTGL
jgi:hypothetical protein